jgi:hypothetical protein
MEILQLLCSRRYCPANVSQLHCYTSWITHRMAAISYQHPSFLFTDWPRTEYRLLSESESESASELLYNWQFTANQVVLESSPLRLSTSIFFNWILAFVVLMYHSLWQEDGFVVYNYCWSSPAQSFSGPTPAGLVTIFYSLRFETPPTWRAWSPYLNIPGTRWSSFNPSLLLGCVLGTTPSARTAQKTPFPTVPLLLCVKSLPWEPVCFAVAT